MVEGASIAYMAWIQTPLPQHPNYDETKTSNAGRTEAHTARKTVAGKNNVRSVEACAFLSLSYCSWR